MRLEFTACLSLFAVFVFVGPRSPARAADDGGNAAACKPINGAHRADFALSTNGAFNISTSSFRSITCGTFRTTTSSPTVLQVDYYDATPGNLISCGLQVLHWNTAHQLFLQNAFSGNEQVGSGTFRFIIPSSIVGHVQITCTMPPATSASGGRSGIRGFRF